MPHHKSMVSPGFAIPDRVSTERFLVRPLLFTDAALDYGAWSTSIEHLQSIFGPHSSWPNKEMTLEENGIDLAWHQREHEWASSFAYTVSNLDETVCLGCIYLSPARKVGYDAEVFYWVRASEATNGFDASLGRFVHTWLSTAWPFSSVVYPGRDLEWEEYLSMDDRPHW
ncbi:MAG: hypothetical protein ACR2JX_10565 [Mycobacteriales bacterium]